MKKPYFVLVALFLLHFSHSQNSGFFKKSENHEYTRTYNNITDKNNSKRFFKVETDQESDEDQEIIETTNNSISEEGDQIKFLDSPVENGKITSKYSGRRFHPITKEWKAHHGTDFAAPYGAPIQATAGGIVETASFTSGNGYYVKIKHNQTYTTQYLHMSKILVSSGQKIKKGETIGLVGSTGLATGPHVCYRFWKNGVQIDPFDLNLEFNREEKDQELSNNEDQTEEDNEIEFKKFVSGFFKD